MLAELLVATAMVLATVLIHGFGLQALAHMLRLDRPGGFSFGPLSLKSVGLTVLVVLGLFVLHGMEIWLYALLYVGIGAAETLRDAIYFSTITFGAIGFGDDPLSPEWRLVAGIEGINGVLLIGWSVAFFVTVMDRFKAR